MTQSNNIPELGPVPLEVNPELLKGVYANSLRVGGSQWELILDFSFQTGILDDESQKIKGSHVHIARIIMPRDSAKQLRELFNRDASPEGDEQ